MKHSKQRTKIQTLQQHQQRRGRRRFSAMVVRASILLAIFVSMLLYLGLISKITNNIASSSNDILDENYKIPTLLKPVKQMHNSESTEHEPFHNESNENKNTPAHENLLLPAKSDITVAYGALHAEMEERMYFLNYYSLTNSESNSCFIN
jgi:predicted PurR-regulated permease PerM